MNSLSGLLSGHTILNTRASLQSQELTSLLQSAGGTVCEYPCLEFIPTFDAERFKEIESRVNEDTWLLFTSAVAVDMLAVGMSVKNHRLAVIGKKTAERAAQHGARVEFVSSVSNSEAFAEQFLEYLAEVGSSSGVLLLRGSSGSNVLPKALAKAGVSSVAIDIYDSVMPTSSLELTAGLLERVPTLSLLSFTSSDIVRNFVHSLRSAPSALEQLKSLPAVVIGEKTELTARECGFREVIVAAEPTIQEVARSLIGRANL